MSKIRPLENLTGEKEALFFYSESEAHKQIEKIKNNNYAWQLLYKESGVRGGFSRRFAL